MSNLDKELYEVCKTHFPIGKVIASNEELDDPMTKIVNLQANESIDKTIAQIKSTILKELEKEWPLNFDVASDPMIIAARRGALNDCLEVVRKTLQ